MNVDFWLLMPNYRKVQYHTRWDKESNPIKIRPAVDMWCYSCILSWPIFRSAGNLAELDRMIVSGGDPIPCSQDRHVEEPWLMLQTKNADSIQHSSEKEFIYFKVHLSIRLQCPQFQGLIWLLLISYLNQQTVVYSFIGAKLNRQLQGGYSYKNLQHKFKFCLYLQNGLIKYPSYLQVSSTTHSTRWF